jgi:integrase
MEPGSSPDERSDNTEPATAHEATQPLPSAASEFDRFLAEAERRKAQRGRSDRPQDWCHPDPAAAAALAEKAHPVSRAVACWGTPRGQRDCVSRFRLVCGMLRDAEPGATTDADVRVFAWHHLTPEQAADYRQDIYRRYTKQSTRNDYVCFLRNVVQQCYKAGLVSPLRRDLILEQLHTTSPGRSTKRRRLSQAEVSALLEACETTGTLAARCRNTAIVALLRTSGMRSCELVKLELGDWDRQQGTMLLRDTKNGSHHTIFVHEGAAFYVQRWVEHRGQAPGALFTPVDKESTRSVSTFAVRFMLKSRAKVAGVAPFGAHDFRRTFATELLRTHDHALVSRLLNHSKLSSTLVYDLAEDDLQRAAVETVRLFADPEDDQDGPAGVLA